MIDKILLFPYWLALKIRHFLYDTGTYKVESADVPTICVGNVSVGGTGKTPHTEMLLRMLLEDSEWGGKNIAVLSRGYKRKTKGFQQVVADGTSKEYGDEPLQIKKKFPQVTVAVDASRLEGCDFLAHPEKLHTKKQGKRCKNKDFAPADLIILDDAFQHRALKPSLSIVLTDYNRPSFNDYLLPVGRLRDLRERLSAADIVIVSKCPADLNPWQKCTFAENCGLKMYDPSKCCGQRKDGSIQHIFFTHITYDAALPVFPEANQRYLYTKNLVLFTGIANDRPLMSWLNGTYKVVKHFNFPDHHNFTGQDISRITAAAREYPTAVLMTTEKDAQRLADCGKIKEELKQKMFYSPIKTEFFDQNDREMFISVLNSALK